jgi:enoyl-CoA hydratase/carnithine racemase
MSADGFETILLDVNAADHVATITLNRPDQLNTFNRTMCEEMVQAWRAVKLDESVHAVVLRAAGTRAFSAGLDITKTPARRSALNGRRCGSRWCAQSRVCALPADSTSSTNPMWSSAQRMQRFSTHTSLPVWCAH